MICKACARYRPLIFRWPGRELNPRHADFQSGITRSVYGSIRSICSINRSLRGSKRPATAACGRSRKLAEAFCGPLVDHTLPALFKVRWLYSGDSSHFTGADMDNFLDADSVAKIFGVSTRTLRTWVKKRAFLAPIKLGRKPLWLTTQLNDWTAKDAPRRDGEQKSQPAVWSRRGRPRNTL
jgi:predicted DNA-binding transcriptional regulator AlpA